MHTTMELRMRNRVCKECADLQHVHFEGKCHFFCSLRINNRIPVQNASLIAEIPFNWTIANTGKLKLLD